MNCYLVLVHTPCVYFSNQFCSTLNKIDYFFLKYIKYKYLDNI